MQSFFNGDLQRMESILFEPTVLNTGYLLPLAVGRGIFLLAVY